MSLNSSKLIAWMGSVINESKFKHSESDYSILPIVIQMPSFTIIHYKASEETGKKLAFSGF